MWLGLRLKGKLTTPCSTISSMLRSHRTIHPAKTCQVIDSVRDWLETTGICLLRRAQLSIRLVLVACGLVA